ncbi:MAG: amidohydrolase family protein [Gammaproteobacteria bacterium]|jgi:imidazolonepropionase-like amidohydrolase|nr:amidohydrolase family protein [Gammaproteobacteria bacterium]
MKRVLLVMGLLGVTSLSAEELLIKNVRLVETSFQSGKVSDLRIVDGIITQIGADLVASAGTAVFDGEARAVTPGFIDSGTTIGLAEVQGLGVSRDGEQVDDDMTAGFQVYLALNEDSSLIPIATNDGITRGLIVPGAGDSNYAGQSALVRFKQGPTFLNEETMAQHLYLREGDRRRAGGSRSSALAAALEALEESARYDKQRRAFNTNRNRSFDLDESDLVALSAVRRGEMPLVVQVDRAADIIKVVTAFRSYPDLRLILASAAEAWKVAPLLSAENIPVLINVMENLPQNFDRLGARLDQATLLADAGVTFAFLSGSPYSETRSLGQAAGVAVAQGLSWQQAIAAITSVPAAIWGLAGLGRIERGAIADLVIWDGDPLEVTSAPLAVLIDGEWVDLETRQSALANRYVELLNLK